MFHSAQGILAQNALSACSSRMVCDGPVTFCLVGLSRVSPTRLPGCFPTVNGEQKISIQRPSKRVIFLSLSPISEKQGGTVSTGNGCF